MTDVYICDGVRTPVGRYGGGLSGVRVDDLAAVSIRALMERNGDLDWAAVDDVMFGCANQAGEDNRNVARMASLLAGLPETVGASTINRLCASGLSAAGFCANTIRAGEAELMIAGGVEGMTRAPFVLAKASHAYDRSAQMFDTTMGWRFVNRQFKQQFGTDSMPETAENLAKAFSISREDQDQFALWSQRKAAGAQADGRLAEEITPVRIPQRKGDAVVIDQDEHPRSTSLEKLAALRALFEGGTITAGNASGINDASAALLLASESAVTKHELEPKVRILGTAVAGVPPRIMGIGPVPATQKLLKRLGLTLDDMDIMEFNEAFAAQVLACTRQLGLADNDARINPQGGAIALGHPLGMSGSRLILTAMSQLQRTGGKLALCTMCIGVGQGAAMVIERV